MAGIVSPNSADFGSDLIFLIGFMGCGKTTLGRKLASRLGYDFIDLDHAFEKQEGMTIAEYFSSFGEGSFREKESTLLKQTIYPKRAVISTGGGLPCFFDNMEWMNAHGKTIYIKLSPKTLADRLEHEKHKRPVLNGRNETELIDFIEEKLSERDKFYSRAKIIADGIGLTAEKVETLLAIA
jgi:shikimate kinase